MNDKAKIRLTAAEMSMIWTQYINDTSSICVNSHFLEKVEDEEVRPVIEFALNGSKQNISFLNDFFIHEKFPVPIGFTDKDVNTRAPKLFSDTYVLMYLRNMSVLGMAAEITFLFNNVQTNAIGKTLITGFAQTAKNKEVIDYFLRGKQIAQKHIDIFSNYLKKEDLPAPMTWDTSLSDSTFPAFSDKLMMFHVSAMIAAGIGNYGASMAASPRRDLAIQYASLIPEITFYAEDGANIMIKHGWLEEPPQTDDRDLLIKGD